MVRTYTLRPAESAPRLALDYAGALDPQQLAAATAGPGATLIVAGAGTGKTRTLVHRLAWLVETGTPPEAIALVTFTRRAAHEMIQRAGALLDGRLAHVRGGTFHSLCADLLRRHAPRVGLPPRFTILDAEDAADLLDLLRTERRLDRAEVRFPRKKTLAAVASAVAATGRDLDDVLADDFRSLLRHRDTLAELLGAYAARKRALGMADYDDLLTHTLALFATHDDVRRAEAARLRHVLVDEYQDVNHAQADLVAALSSVHGNVTMVGDEAQSIYGFRGASVRHILDVPARYPGARVLRLERNYRSVQPVLDLANRVTAGAAEGYAKVLVAAGTEAGEKPAMILAPDDDWEARFVAQMVLERREAGVPLARQAVLMRASWCSFTLEAELSRRGIPFVKVGGLRLAEAAHVKDVVAHLRVAENAADTVAWNRILRLVDGVGTATAHRLLAWIEQASTTGDPDGPGQAALALRDATVRLPARAADGLAHLTATLADLRASDAPPDQQVERLLAYYAPLLPRLYPDDHADRAADLDALAAIAARHRSRAAFLDALALDPLDLTAEASDATLRDEAPLVLSTIHSAKGLEFDTVFLLHALDGVLPHAQASRTAGGEEEERRLLYVAVTRAETHLFVSVPLVQHARGAGAFLSEPSRFLSPLPEALLEPWRLDEAPPAPLTESLAPPHLPGGGG